MDAEPVAVTLRKLCTGPIYAGEPVVTHGDGLAHRFSTWCDHYRKAIAARDEKFLSDVGISE